MLKKYEVSIYKSRYPRGVGFYIASNGNVELYAYDTREKDTGAFYLNAPYWDSELNKQLLTAAIKVIDDYIAKKNEEYLRKLRKENNEYRRNRSERQSSRR